MSGTGEAKPASGEPQQAQQQPAQEAPPQQQPQEQQQQPQEQQQQQQQQQPQEQQQQQPQQQAPKSEQAVQPVNLDSQQQAKLLRQVEFYFSDSNLPKDKFLKNKVSEDPTGYVDLNIITAFARMRELLKIQAVNPSTVPAGVVAAVANVIRSQSGMLEVNEQGTRVRRKIPLGNTEQVSAEIDARSLYAKPFPMDVNLDKLTEFFAQHAPVNCVRMRRHPTSKNFKGSVFVEFASVADAEKVLGMQLEYAGAPLRMQKKVAYITGKAAERKAKAANKANEDDEVSNDELPDGVGGTVGGEIVESRRAHVKEGAGDQSGNQQESKKRGRDEEGQQGGKAQKQQKGEGEQQEGEQKEGEQQKEGGDEEMEEQEEEEKLEFVPGCLFSFALGEGEVLPDDVGPFEVKDAFGGREKVVFVEIAEDKKTGIFRYPNPEAASEALAAFNAKPEEERCMGGKKATLKRVEGEEEEGFYKRAAAHRKQSGPKRGRGGRRGGRGGQRGRGRGGRRGGRGRR